MKFFFFDHEGKPSSALVFRAVWQLVLLATYIYYVCTKEIEFILAVGTAATLAGIEGFSYNQRRKQSLQNRNVTPKEPL